MTHVHAVVWLDHRSARVISFSLDSSDVTEIESGREDRRLHRKSGIPGSGHAATDLAMFDEVVAAIGDVRSVLLTAPGTAKKAFQQHLEDEHPEVARRIVGVETIDHPSTGELLAFGQAFFKRFDRLGLAPG
jgi:hypothetical protein